MLSVLHCQSLRVALTVPQSTARLRFSAFPRTTSQHTTRNHNEYELVIGNMEKMNV